MKLIRLQSGPLACVYQDNDVAEAPSREVSVFFRAFSGSVEAAGASESEALDALDRNLRRLSTPPDDPDQDAGPELDLLAAHNDTDHCPPPFQSLPPLARCAPDTIRAPRPSSLPAIAFAKAR